MPLYRNPHFDSTFLSRFRLHAENMVSTSIDAHIWTSIGVREISDDRTKLWTLPTFFKAIATPIFSHQEEP